MRSFNFALCPVPIGMRRWRTAACVRAWCGAAGGPGLWSCLCCRRGCRCRVKPCARAAAFCQQGAYASLPLGLGLSNLWLPSASIHLTLSRRTRILSCSLCPVVALCSTFIYLLLLVVVFVMKKRLKVVVDKFINFSLSTTSTYQSFVPASLSPPSRWLHARTQQ